MGPNLAHINGQTWEWKQIGAMRGAFWRFYGLNILSLENVTIGVSAENVLPGGG